MLKKHIVLFESKDHGWIAYSTTGSDAKRILSVNNKSDIFYIFECDLLKQYPYTMKLKAPLNKYYDCKRINKYKEEIFEENDKYILISSKTEGEDEGIYFVVKHN
jgi:hypothetical protein